MSDKGDIPGHSTPPRLHIVHDAVPYVPAVEGDARASTGDGPDMTGPSPEMTLSQTESSAGGDGERGGGKGRPGDLPPFCPVTPLGSNGDMYFFLDYRKDFRVFSYEKLLRAAPNSLLGPHIAMHGWAWKHFPSHNKEGEQTGWNEKNCGRALLIAAAKLDIWNALDRVRGAGCWKGEAGELIVHLGDQLLVDGRACEPGVIGRHVYPAAAPQPRPWHEPVEGGRSGPADELLGILSSWNWERGDIDPLLLLGWMGAAMLGGALTWRPSACITGDMGAGKSTMEECVRDVVGGMVHASDATAASLWTALGYSSLPIQLDEFENDADDRKSTQIINLMRLSASGGIILRGSADHKLAQFQARSAFLFSGINPPPMKPQDLSRLAMLELRPFREDAEETKPDLAPERLREIGARMRRRMYDNWPRWPRVLNAYRVALLLRGHSQRGADQFGTLLAAAEILLRDADDFKQAIVDSQCDALCADRLAETANNDRQHEECLGFVLSAIADQWQGGKQRTVAQHIRTILRSTDASDSRQALGLLGLRVMLHEDVRYLAVANGKHQGIQRLFSGSRWKNGGHERLMRRLPGYVVPKGPAISIGGVQSRCTLIPIDLCINVDAMREEEDAW